MSNQKTEKQSLFRQFCELLDEMKRKDQNVIYALERALYEFAFKEIIGIVEKKGHLKDFATANMQEAWARLELRHLPEQARTVHVDAGYASGESFDLFIGCIPAVAGTYAIPAVLEKVSAVRGPDSFEESLEIEYIVAGETRTVAFNPLFVNTNAVPGWGPAQILDVVRLACAGIEETEGTERTEEPLAPSNGNKEASTDVTDEEDLPF